MKSDRNGTEHTSSFDVLGQLITDAATALGAGINGAVRRLETLHDQGGRPYLFTSYDAASAGSTVNQVFRDFNGFGQLITEFQAHGGAVDGNTPYVSYAFSETSGGTVNHSWLTGITYPTTSRTPNVNYTGLDSTISRLYRQNHLRSDHSELYHGGGTGGGYDKLNQLTGFQRGTLNAAKDNATESPPPRSQGWGFDALGNWLTFTTDTSTQTRTHNLQNQILTVSGAASNPTYDPSGNTTRDEGNRTFVYDAWNRLASATYSAGTAITPRMRPSNSPPVSRAKHKLRSSSRDS